MALVIPFSSDNPISTFSTTLDGAQYTFFTRWNERDNYDPVTKKSSGAWYFDIKDADNKPVADGIKVVLGLYLGRAINHPLFRDGVIVAVDLSGQGREAGIDDLGNRVQVLRLTTGEVLSLRITRSFPDPSFPLFPA